MALKSLSFKKKIFSFVIHVRFNNHHKLRKFFKNDKIQTEIT